MTEYQFRNKYDIYPVAGFLSDITERIPDGWLQNISPVDTNIPPNHLYLKNENMEWVELHALNAKKIYTVSETLKPKGYSCSQRWLKAYNNDPIFDSVTRWEQWFLLPYGITHEVQLQSFMFKIWYRIIPCRVYLTQIRVMENETCPRCAQRDDLLHFFFECQVVKSFWDSLATWLEGREGVKQFPEDLAEEELLLGVTERDGDYSLFNYILLLAKFYIYKTSIFNLGEPDLFQFLAEMKGRLYTEQGCSYLKGSFQKRFKRWETFYNNL